MKTWKHEKHENMKIMKIWQTWKHGRNENYVINEHKKNVKIIKSIHIKNTENENKHKNKNDGSFD